MKFKKDFIGLDGFYWWIGVVENRKDPLGLGRCQVRIFGAHTQNLSDIPSEDLPWAQPIHALNNQTFSTPKEGDFVFGFFLDGRMHQSPVMMGVVPGIPQVQTEPSTGFSDQRNEDSLTEYPRKPANLEFKDDGSGVAITEAERAERYPTQEQLGYPTNSPLAGNENVKTTIIQKRRDNIVSVDGNETQWSEPSPAYSAVYPFNKVLETESGHAMEFDDTPGSERVHIAHRTGSFMEFYPSGSKVEKIVKNNYKIVLSDDKIYISGQADVTVAGGSNIRIIGDVNILAENDVGMKVAGDVNMTVGGTFNLKAKEINLESETNMNFQASANYSVDASLININKGASRDTGLGAAPARGTPNQANLFVEPTPTDRAAVFFDAGEKGVDEHIKEQIDKGIYKQEQIDEGAAAKPIEQDNSKPEVPTKADVNCEGIENLSDFPSSLRLSPSFTLGALTGSAPFGNPLREQRGLTKGQIACNLKLLAINCLEPIKQKYSSALITNAFRYPTGAAAGRSQHEVGQAADIQFPGISKEEYYDIALWIRDNVPHDQLLLEYKTTGSRMPWIHISFNKEGNRASGTKHATFMNHRKYSDGFVRLV